MVLLPELAPVIFLYVGLICGIHLISALSVLWQQLTDSSLPLLQKWIIGARFLGNLLGAILGTAGVMEGFKAAKIRLYRDMINESGLSPEVVEKLNKNAAKNDYVKLIDEASKLSKNGVSDEAICEILDRLTTNNVAR